MIGLVCNPLTVVRHDGCPSRGKSDVNRHLCSLEPVESIRTIEISYQVSILL